NKTEIEEKKEKELENDIFSRYDKDDISAIKELVKTTLIEEKENKTRISQQEKDRNAQDNEAYWSSMSLKIKSKNPDLFNKIESTLLAEMEDKGKDQTLQHAGWVQDRIGDLLLDPSGSTGV
ncbi:MAG: hypothetical protein GTO02_01720, partial [Candidatus Dadabacteria bacterium]|nr:hypothetical protein [Candidatus Dadabacteria bacterium]